ncbi:MAG: 2-keto-3-deoxy-L-fuconate dehydrogenase [Verrucomicrobiales bacterium]|jgi:2-keto-3-deoxy-L-fuconate dehydrogenase
MGRLSDLSIIVTGTSSGIGEAIANRFWEEGARLTIGSRTKPSHVGAGVRWHQTDVSDPNAADALIAHAVDHWGKLDVLVNNAGVQVERSIAETTDEEYDAVMDVNVRGVFNCARAAVRQIRSQPGGGAIINIGSISGDSADHGMAIYNASKGAVHAMTRSIAIDHGRDGIRCNAIAPGWIATALADAAFDMADDPTAARDTAVGQHPVGRLGLPGDVANLAVWLASEESGFASGSVFTIDGGLTAQSPIG